MTSRGRVIGEKKISTKKLITQLYNVFLLNVGHLFLPPSMIYIFSLEVDQHLGVNQHLRVTPKRILGKIC